MTEEMEQAEKAGLDPLMEKSLGDLVKDIPKRVVGMLSKLLSIKGVCLGLASFLLLSGHLESWGWLAVVGIVIFDKAFLKFLKDVRR